MIGDEKDVVIQHAFETPERLKIALLVGAAYPDIRERLIRQTLQDIQTRLKVALGADWAFEPVDDLSGEWYFSLRRADWPKNMTLGFGRDGSGQALYFYVNRWVAPEKMLPIDDQVREALESQLAPGGKPTEWCCWWKCLDRYKNWDSVDTVLELAKDHRAAEYVAAFLLNIGQVVQPILRAHAKGGART
jgi:hypothetical protein